MSFQIYFRDMRHGHERISVCVADSLEEFRNTTVEELKRKLIPEDQLEDTILRYRFKTLQENRTHGFYGIKHEDHIYAVRRRIKDTKPDNYDLEYCAYGIYEFDEECCYLTLTGVFEDEGDNDDDDEDDEDEIIPRSQSMDNLLMMHQPQLEPSE